MTFFHTSSSITLKLFLLPVNFLKFVRDYALAQGCLNTLSLIYRLVSVICDVALSRFLKPVRSEPLHDEMSKFLPIQLSNKGIEAILHDKKVTS